MKNLVIIPTFNEIENIPLILKEIINLNMNLDVLVVDDNSPDKTYQKVEQLKQKYPNLFLILNNKKSGIGKAYLKGFNFAIKNNYSKVIQIDADMSHNPYDIKKLLSESNDYDLVIGSRYIDGIRIINWPLSRLALSYFANLYAKLITGLSIYDCTGGFICFDIKILKSIDLKKINSQGYSFQIEATDLTIEPSLSKKSTQNTPFNEEWGNTVFENEDGYYGSDSAEAGQYTFIISSKYMRTYNDTVAVETTVTKILDMGEGKSYAIIGYPAYGEYNWSVSEY